MCTYSRCACMMGWVVSRDTLHVIINFNVLKSANASYATALVNVSIHTEG